MGFVRRHPGEEMPAPQWCDGLRHFLSPSRRYTRLVWPPAGEFNVHAGVCSAFRQARRRETDGTVRASATYNFHTLTRD